MAIFYGQDFGTCKTAYDVLTQYPLTAGRDGYYFIYPNGRNSSGKLVYCDMTTDGGGWMMIARSHPTTVNYGSTNWGWLGNEIGSIKDFSQAYQAGWALWNTAGATFTSFIFGNRKNINTNEWGPFIYKNSAVNYTNLMTSDTQQSATRSVVKTTVNIYDTTSYPGMQNAIGFATTGTTNNIYYLRDCCGFSSAYGGKPTSFGTTYCNDSVRCCSAGPWCNGNSYDGNGDFTQGGTLYGSNYHGGTNQYMIMVK
jgi:hypothetical protein